MQTVLLISAIVSAVFLVSQLTMECWRYRLAAQQPGYRSWRDIMQRSITDEEFLAAVPHASPQRALRIRAIISDQLDIPERCIHPSDRFVEDLRAG